MNRYRNIVERINHGLFLAVIALLPYPQVLLRYACAAWLISWLLECRWLSRPKPFSGNRMVVPFLLFGLWYGWKAVSGLWAADSAAWAWQMERYMLFVLMVPLALWGVNKHYDWRQAGRIWAISSLVAVPVYVLVMAVFYHFPALSDSLFEQGVLNSQGRDWWTFFSEDISHIKHRLFLSGIMTMGGVLAIQVWHDRRWVPAVMIPLMLAFIAMTGSRQALLTGILVITVAVVFSLPQRLRKRYGLALTAAGVLVGGLLLMFHPRMQDIDWRALKEMREVSYYHDVRFNIWGCALQRPQEYAAYGLGAGQSTEYLAERYAEAGLTYYAQDRLHCHNQYLEELMETGVGGLLFFVLIWFAIPLCARGEGRQTAVAFTLLYLLNMFTDCMFGLFDGLVLWAVGLLLVFLQSDPQREEKSARDTETH